MIQSLSLALGRPPEMGSYFPARKKETGEPSAGRVRLSVSWVAVLRGLNCPAKLTSPSEGRVRPGFGGWGGSFVSTTVTLWAAGAASRMVQRAGDHVR